jgi:tetratricopeptide (TPR) repeat protein
MHSGFHTSTGQSNDNRYCIMPKRFEIIVKQLLYSLILLIHSSALGQSNSIQISEPNPDSNKELAFVLYEQNDFTRAALLLEDIVEANPRDELSYRRYIQCLIKTNQQEKAIKFIKKRIKKSPYPTLYVVDECWVNTTFPEGPNKQKFMLRAEELKSLIIEQLRVHAIEQMGEQHLAIAQRFEQNELKNYAIEVLQSAEQILGEGYPDISNKLAELYMETGNREKGLQRYVMLMLSGVPFESMKQVFESQVTDSLDYVILQRLLLKQIEQNPEVSAFSEGLKWTFVKQGNWQAAFLYTRSLDKRLKENGERVFELGELCQSNGDFNVALKCFQYCIDLKEIFFDPALAQAKWIDVTYDITMKGKPSKEDVIQLQKQMLGFEENYGPQESSLSNALKYAQLLIRYDSLFTTTQESGKISGSQQAINLLEKYINPSTHLKKVSLARVKLTLGDVLLSRGDVWTSELLYAQVEKDFTEEEMGQFAKFKRAELSFYRGDFDWASMQLEVLKSATTQLISNDAMELALVIIDNLGIDSNYTALTWYGKALLAEKQQHYYLANKYLDSITTEFPGHGLSDEILFVKARMSEAKGDYATAANLLETLAIAYNFDILADNALYKLGMIYLYSLNQPEKAKKTFETLIEKYSSSVYIVDARREYRKIRGN